MYDLLFSIPFFKWKIKRKRIDTKTTCLLVNSWLHEHSKIKNRWSFIKLTEAFDRLAQMLDQQLFRQNIQIH